MKVLHHDSTPACLERRPDGRWRFTLLAGPGARLEKVELNLDQCGNDPWVVAQRRGAGAFEAWSAEAALPPGPVTYRFRVEEGGVRSFVDATGRVPYRGGAAGSFRFEPGAEPPDWVADQVFYQVFPDRFRRGAGSAAWPPPGGGLGDRDRRDRIVPRAWGERPVKEQGGREIYGGDLDGIVEGLDHVRELGATALYLNPIFDSPSAHRYDTRDYHAVCPRLGGTPAYRRLVAALRGRGMRLVLDGVFNHTGNHAEWFAPRPRRGFYTRRGGGYVSWWGIDSLPKLDFAHPEVVDAIYRGPDSVVRRWLAGEHGADGWRLDVAACLGEGGSAAGNVEHLRGILAAARAARPDAYVFGEVFETAGWWLEQRAFDATMNYAGFTFPTLEWVAGRDQQGFPVPGGAAGLWDAWQAHLPGRSFGQRLAAFNLLGSHDVPRVMTRVMDPRKSLLAHALLFAFPGVPCVYAGDEIGMEGGPDPDCRRPFPWDRGSWDQTLHRGIRRLAAARTRSLALRRGGLTRLVADGDLLAFVRQAGPEIAVLVAHRGEGRREVVLDLAPFGLGDQALDEVLGGGSVTPGQGRVALTLDGPEARLLLPRA